MKTVFGLLLIFLGLVSFGYSQSNNDRKAFILLGKVIGKDSGSIEIMYSSASYIMTNNSFDRSNVKDTAIIKNGEFYFEGNISSPTWVLITIGKRQRAGLPPNMTHFYIDPGVNKITLKMDDFNHPEVTGSITQNESIELNALEATVYKNITPLDSLLSMLNSNYYKFNDTLLVPQVNRLYDQKDSILSQVFASQIRFIRSHPRSFISEILLTQNSRLTDDLSLDSLKTFYNGLDSIIQNRACGQMIKKEIAKKELSDIGKPAPDFSTQDINNQSLKLSSFQGKNEVLLYFWGSRNPLSRKNIPLLKEVHQKYHSKGLEIICVSTEFHKTEWTKAVTQDSLEMFHNVITSSKFVQFKPLPVNLFENYGVQEIPYDLHRLPVEILIDKTGRIIGRWKEDFQRLNAKLAEVYNEIKL
jgi:peroxiredoxin